MNKNGFTIIEVVASIALIMLLTVLVITSVAKTGDESKLKIYESKILLALTAAEDYGTDIIDNLSSECTEVKIGDLVRLEYLDEELIDPRTNESMNNVWICIKYQNKKIKSELRD